MSMSQLTFILIYYTTLLRSEELHRQALELYEKMLGPEHPDTLMNMNNLAVVLEYERKYTGANSMHLRTSNPRARMMNTATAGLSNTRTITPEPSSSTAAWTT